MILAIVVLWAVCFHGGLVFCKYTSCKAKDFGYGSVVCVCDQLHCDGFQDIPRLNRSEYLVYTSTKSGLRFSESVHNVAKMKKRMDSENRIVIKIDVHSARQKVQGFGGAFTDSASKLIMEMPEKLQNNVLESYFSPSGIGYTFGRVPIASCDFSPRVYSYDETPGDFDLSNFTLTNEDLKLKIPAIKLASRYNNTLKLFGSPWSAPAWMKTSGSMIKAGTLKGVAGDKYHKTWANYLVKFLKSYEAEGLPRFWGISVQNEPNDALIKSFSFQNMGYTPETSRDFIKKDLGPALHNNGYGDLQLMILDDQRAFIHAWTDTILSDPESSKYVRGVGFHWYLNFLNPPISLDLVHKKFPDVFLLGTEACAGFMTPIPSTSVILGSWERGEQYSHDIMQDMNHWTSGWVDWNLVLNTEGGPRWTNRGADACIISDPKEKVFYKQPTYYHLGHFSKFVTPGSINVESFASKKSTLELAAFARPDSAIVIVILNQGSEIIPIKITEATFGEFNTDVPARSIQTYILGPSGRNSSGNSIWF